MKTKKFGAKLELNKKTISNLGSGEMKDVQGGLNSLTGECVLRATCFCSIVVPCSNPPACNTLVATCGP